MAIINILGAYLHVNMDERFIMLLNDMLENLVEMIYPKLYRKFLIINSKGWIMLYVKIHKAIYGLLRSAFFYKMLVKYLEVDRLF